MCASVQKKSLFYCVGNAGVLCLSALIREQVTILTGAQKHMMDELHLQEKIARARREIDKLEDQLSQVQKGVTKDVSDGKFVLSDTMQSVYLLYF